VSVIVAGSDACHYNCDDVDILVFVPRATPTSTHSVSSPMPVDPPPSVYRDQLAALSHGIPLWNPDPPRRNPPRIPNSPRNSNLPEKIYENVSIGDVGYLHEGTFIRMFNVMLPWNHPSNRTLGDPEPYETLDFGPFDNTFRGLFDRVEHYSRYVSPETNAGNVLAREPDQ
jgi:hypothetical protein